MTNTNASAQKTFESKWLILTAVMLSQLMASLDASIVNTVLPSITDFFDSEISIAQWVPTVYLLTISCLLLLYGRLGDMVGHKKILLYGLAGFTVASALCGSSQSMWMLIAFRALQGLAAGMMMAVGFAIVTAAFPATERGKALGIYTLSIAVAMGLGPTIGGLIAEHLSWRYIFFINVPIGIAALLWGSRVLPQGTTRPGQRLDLPGALAALVFLPTLLLYFNRGEDWGWASPVPLTLLAVAVVSGVLFFWIERTSKQPMLTLTLFANRVFTFASLSHLLSYVAYMALVFLTPFYLKFVLDYSIFKVGLVMATFPLVLLIVQPLSGTASDRIGTRVFAIAGMCIVALGFFFFSGLKESASAFDVVWRLAIVGLGIGIFATPNVSTIMGSVPPQYLGVTSGLQATMRSVGMVFGVAMAGGILHSLAPISTSTNPGSFTSADIAEFMYGLRWTYISGAAFAAAAALTSILAIGRRPQA